MKPQGDFIAFADEWFSKWWQGVMRDAPRRRVQSWFHWPVRVPVKKGRGQRRNRRNRP